ncbi:UbiA family prenyltransferase [Saccharothrix australiensis]|uniref:4-hydroxybenzoate polyprenyltransferase n=1 Tax=Saccharothrix australiensis TaxID=2072 RepID=A0A495W1Z2_9PSEU|nr:UbiA family prenyltransferase [Saccharothrix australiensis]RKT55150.1 4-hydroxybenzoate polyprenyltransferase [Saccharothrix australiensis]
MSEVVDPRPVGSRWWAVARSVRPSTRMWYDLVAPGAMILVVTAGRPPLWGTVLALALFVVFHAGHTYFNDVTDVDVDRNSVERDRSDRALVSNRVSRSDMMVTGIGFAAVSLVLALVISPLVLLLTVVATALVLAYNFPPVRLSGRPLATQVFWPVTWALMYAICALATESGDWRDGLPFLAFVVLFMGIGEAITQDTRDADNDEAGGRRTTPVVFGVWPTAVAAWVAQALSVVALGFAVANGSVWPWCGAVAVAGVVAWLARFWLAVARLRRGFDKAEAKLTHVGSIYTFTFVNVVVGLGVVIGG